MTLVFQLCFLFLLATGVIASENTSSFELKAQASSGSQGILLTDLVILKPDQALPRIVLAAAPAIGRPLFIARAQINELLGKKAPELTCTNWTGAHRVKVARATRVLNQATLSELLTSTLQQEYVKERGELELRFTRNWNNVLLPDEPLALKILELPSSGIAANFICRFEVLAGGESAGVYQQGVQAKIWREVYVARSNLMRGQLLREADLALEKRDVLTSRDYLTTLPLEDPFIEFRENVSAGSLITPRFFRLRAIIKRGRQVDAMFQDEALTISVRAEALEDGVPGQIVRLRNVQSRREFKGKVHDEQTVHVLF